MPNPIAFLSFNGNCKEAMRFYERTLGGRIAIMMTGAESPMAAQMPPESGHRIVHARLELPDGGVLCGNDCQPPSTDGACQSQPYEGIKGVTFSLNYDTTEEAAKIFNALADGGKVIMPMQGMFWAKSWGMLVDKYGTPWMVNGELLPG